ncbi:hypothetical protein LguiA_007922 [Lonicera macranthoides]
MVPWLRERIKWEEIDLNGLSLNGCNITVNEAQSRDSNGGGGYYHGGGGYGGRRKGGGGGGYGGGCGYVGGGYDGGVTTTRVETAVVTMAVDLAI